MTPSKEVNGLLGVITLNKETGPMIALQVEDYQNQYPLSSFVKNHLEAGSGLFRFDEGMFKNANIYNLIKCEDYGIYRRINVNTFKSALKSYAYR